MAKSFKYNCFSILKLTQWKEKKKQDKLDLLDIEIKEKLKNWKDIIKNYQKPDTKKALLQLLNTFGPFLVLWILMFFTYQRSYTVTFLLAIICAFLMARIFIIQHDCGHHSFLKSKKWNNIIGYFCSFFSSIPYKYWAKVHNFHHGHNGQLEQRKVGDVPFLTVEEFENLSKWRQIAYRIFRNPFVLFIIAPTIYMTISNRVPIFNFKGWKKTRLSQVWNNLALILVYLILGYLLGWARFFAIQIPIILMFGIIAFWFFYVQHQHEETYKQWKDNWDFLIASIRGSSYYKLPKLLQWFTGNIGFHHIHHLSSSIPNYNLERCSRENPILNKYVTTIRFKESLKCMFHYLWDADSQRMITKKEYDFLKNIRLSS